MASHPISTVLERCPVSPPPATVTDTSIPLTFFDIFHLHHPPTHFVFFYKLPLTKPQFIESIVPSIKHSLSITLQHFFPYAGNLIIFPSGARKPEIRYVQGDSVKVTFAESNLDFRDLTGYHPRNSGKFYHLIPVLGDCSKISDFVKIPVCSLQVTLFPNCGVSIGTSTHHSIVDASTFFNFLNAWASISRCSTDESFLANGTLPVYERMIKYPERDQIYLEHAKLETFNNYQLPKLSGPTDKVRATFILKRAFIDQLKERVSTELPTLVYVSSFTVSCAYIWCCLAFARKEERQAFGIPIDCKNRVEPPIPDAYFGNCNLVGCRVVAKTSLLTGKRGSITAAKLIGENLYKSLLDPDEMLNYHVMIPLEDLLSDGIPTTLIVVGGTPKFRFYDIDFGWGEPKKIERLSMDYGTSISLDAGKESDQDMEFGICLEATQMNDFIRIFNLGLKPYVGNSNL